MEQVDVILSGGSIVTMNERFDVIHDGALAIRGDSIVAVGPVPRSRPAIRPPKSSTAPER